MVNFLNLCLLLEKRRKEVFMIDKQFQISLVDLTSKFCPSLSRPFREEHAWENLGGVFPVLEESGRWSREDISFTSVESASGLE